LLGLQTDFTVVYISQRAPDLANVSYVAFLYHFEDGLKGSVTESGMEFHTRDITRKLGCLLWEIIWEFVGKSHCGVIQVVFNRGKGRRSSTLGRGRRKWTKVRDVVAGLGEWEGVVLEVEEAALGTNVRGEAEACSLGRREEVKDSSCILGTRQDDGNVLSTGRAEHDGYIALVGANDVIVTRCLDAKGAREGANRVRCEEVDVADNVVSGARVKCKPRA